MALNAPNNEVLQRTDLLFGPLPRDESIPPSRLRDDDVIRRAEEKHGPNYLVYVRGNRRVVFDQFLLSTWQKTIDEVAVPNYTRGQPLVEVFGTGRIMIEAQIRLFDSRTNIFFQSPDQSTGYVGSSVREFTRLYDRYFRGSAATKDEGYIILNVKGRRDYGYVTQMAFDRMSPNDYDISASFSFWSFLSEREDVGKALADALIAKTSTPGAIAVDDSF